MKKYLEKLEASCTQHTWSTIQEYLQKQSLGYIVQGVGWGDRDKTKSVEAQNYRRSKSQGEKFIFYHEANEGISKAFWAEKSIDQIGAW